VALLDVQWMLANGTFRVTEGSAAGRESASSSTDAPGTVGRDLSAVEVATINAWLEQFLASEPSSSAPLRAVEELRRGSHSGAGGTVRVP
jgi:hypothetical protein